MKNEEILNNIINKYGIEKSTEFCEIVAMMYDIKYNAVKNINSLSEFDYERMWWSDAYVELKKEIIL